MKIIGLTGPAGAGKDTAAGYALTWCAAEGLHAMRSGFADALKMSAARALGAPPDWNIDACVAFCNELKHPECTINVDHPDGCLAHLSGRHFLQLYGTEAHRDVFGADFWVDAQRRRWEDAKKLGFDAVFVTDVRFKNEADAILQSPDGEIWRIDRLPKKVIDAHVSESPLPEELTTLTLNNYGDPDDLRALVDSICEEQLPW